MLRDCIKSRFFLALGASSLILALGFGSFKSEASPSCQAIFTAPNDLHSAPITDHTDSELTGKISRITITRLNIFNTQAKDENNPLFKFANRINWVTDEAVIKSQLLVSEGTKFDAEQVAESERLLRATPYLYDARIYAQDDCQGGVVLHVVTQDVWTLLPEISFSRSGGDNKTRIGFRDSNLLGLGKRLSLTRTTEKERSGYSIVYDDPNIYHTRYRGRIEYADNSDGKRHYGALSLPFFSLSSEYSYGAQHLYFERERSQYLRATEVNRFKQTTRLNTAYVAKAFFNTPNWTKRLYGGVHFQQENYQDLVNTAFSVSEERDYAYPYVAYSLFENRYEKHTNIDAIARVEDLHLGWDLYAQLGYGGSALDNDQARLAFNIKAQKAYFPKNDVLMRFYVHSHGYWQTKRNHGEDVFVNAGINALYKMTPNNAWYGAFNYYRGHNLSAQNQLTLGGEQGLRGYPNDYLAGNRLMLATLEKRFYLKTHLFQLFNVGAAAFFDIGYSARTSTLAKRYLNDPRFEYSLISQNPIGRIHKNVGIGLRLAPSRSHLGTMIHIDLAYPIDKSAFTDSLQWLVTVKQHF